MLLTSELVTNAIVHAGTDVDVRCEIVDDEVRVEVHDRHRARHIPVPGEQVSGRGLMLPEALATAWGITYGRSDKQVWFTLPAPADVAESADADLIADELTPDLAFTTPTPPAVSSQTVEDIARRIAHGAQDEMSADAVFVMLAEDDAELVVKATAGVGPEAPVLEMELEGAPMGGRGVYADLGGSPYNLPALQAAGVRSLVSAPFIVDGRVIGLVIATASAPDSFEEADVDRLQATADAHVVALERARLMELERSRRGWLGFLAEASSMLAGTLDQQMTMALVAQLVVPRLATWCAVFLVGNPGAGSAATPAYAWHADETMVADLTALLDRLPAESPPAEPGPWTGFLSLSPSWGTGVEPASMPGTAHRVTGDVAHAFPLIARGRRIGILVIGGPIGARFTRDLLELAEDLAGRAALAIDNARLYAEQADMSRALQRSLLPPELPEVPGLDLAVVYDPAGEHSEVGGDFYDIFPVGAGRWRFAIGDVCGTGPEAATVTGLARQTLRILGREDYPVTYVLERLNGLILDEGSRARFLTLLHGEISPHGGGVRVGVALAGHPPPLLLDLDGTVTELGEPQLMLGVFPEATFTMVTKELIPGQVLIGFTDGVTERRSGTRQLGDGRGLETVLAGCAGLGAGAVAARIQRAVRGFSNDPSHDDMALVVLRVR